MTKTREFGHELYGKGFYTAMLASGRLSETKDVIPIMVPERLIDVKADWIGRLVKVSGWFQSYNKRQEKRKHLVLSVFVAEFEEYDPPEIIDEQNRIFLDGYICKQPIYCKTILKREIADILLGVNRPYKKSNYIPCICWGRNARFAGGLEVGTRLQIDGRIQSREYQKWISDHEYETRAAYEVSISKLTLVEETEE